MLERHSNYCNQLNMSSKTALHFYITLNTKIRYSYNHITMKKLKSGINKNGEKSILLRFYIIFSEIVFNA